MLLAATLVGVVLRAAPAGAETPPAAPTDPTTTPRPRTSPDLVRPPRRPPARRRPHDDDHRPGDGGPATPGGHRADRHHVGAKGHPLASALEDLNGSGYVEQRAVRRRAPAPSTASRGLGIGRPLGGQRRHAGAVPHPRARAAAGRSRRFDGTVVVSWLNVNGAFETDPEWTQIGTELMREGAAFVGVSAQMLGVDGPLGARRWDPARYGALDVGADSLSYDVFTQVAQAIRAPKGVDLLGGLSPAAPPDRQRAVAVGTAPRHLPQRLPAHDPRLRRVLPGLPLPWRRAAGSHAAARRGRAEPERTRCRAPVPARSARGPGLGPTPGADPVGHHGAGLRRGHRDRGPARTRPSVQPDSSRFRTWEVAGASDVDSTITAAIVTQLRRDFPSIPTDQLTACAQPNVFPTRYALRAAMRSLATWVAGGAAPASAPPLQLDPVTGAIVRDADGNALGGSAPPRGGRADGPVHAVSPPRRDYCALTGTTVPFSPRPWPSATRPRRPTPTRWPRPPTPPSRPATSSPRTRPRSSPTPGAAPRRR